MPKEYPYDPVGDIALDFELLHPARVERLLKYSEDEWNEL